MKKPKVNTPAAVQEAKLPYASRVASFAADNGGAEKPVSFLSGGPSGEYQRDTSGGLGGALRNMILYASTRRNQANVQTGAKNSLGGTN